MILLTKIRHFKREIQTTGNALTRSIGSVCIIFIEIRETIIMHSKNLIIGKCYTTQFNYLSFMACLNRYSA